MEMTRYNYSIITEFVLEGLTAQPELQLPLFFLFLVIYGVTIMGNLGMILLITFNPNLQSPMYFFLRNLSCLDFFYSSVVIPKLLRNFMWKQNIISYSGCMTQLFFFCVFAIAESYMLTAMAYDRYIAICKPLLYTATMSQKVCNALVAGVYVMSTFGSVVHTASMVRLCFCRDNVIHHYFCDILPLLELSCSNTYLNKLLVVFVGGFNMVATTVPIAISYAFILSTILQITSSEGRSKTFSTCGSHLMAIGMFYGSVTFMYFKPASSNNRVQEKIASVLYTTIIPMLNPLIYSLRNKDVKKVLSKVMRKTYGPPWSYCQNHQRSRKWFVPFFFLKPTSFS